MIDDWADEIAASLFHEASIEGYDGCLSFFNEASENDVAAALRAAELRGRVAGMARAHSIALEKADWWLKTDDIQNHYSASIIAEGISHECRELKRATKLESPNPTECDTALPVNFKGET